jgi:uncharacterized protein
VSAAANGKSEGVAVSMAEGHARRFRVAPSCKPATRAKKQPNAAYSPARAMATAAQEPSTSGDERAKVRAAIRTDFVLSAEIIVITLGTVTGQPLTIQIGVLTSIAALMTAGVYGLVAGIVRLDDIGLYLSLSSDGRQRRLGRAILAGAPYLMRTLSVVGTAAMFLVGGGILTHGFPGAHDAIDQLAEPTADVPLFGNVLGPVAALVANGLAGVLAGAAVFGAHRAARAVLTAFGIGHTRSAAGHCAAGGRARFD